MSAGLTFDTKNVVNSADAAISKIDKLTSSIEKLDKTANGVHVPPIEVKAALDHLELSKNIRENVARAQAGLPPVIIDGYVKVTKIKKADNPTDYENILANSPGYKRVNQHSAMVAVNQAEALTKQVYKAVEVTQTFGEVWRTAFSLPPNAQRALMGDVKHVKDLSKAVTDYGAALKNLSTGKFTTVKGELGQAQELFEARRQMGPMTLGQISMSQTSGAMLGVKERLQMQEGKDELARQKATLAQRESFFKASRDLEAGDVKAMQAYIRRLQGLQTMLSQVSAENKDWMVSNLSRKHGTEALANLDTEIPRLQRLVADKQAKIKQAQGLNAFQKIEGDLVSSRSLESLDRLGVTLKNLKRDFESGIDTSRVYSGQWARLAQADVERLLSRYNELREQRAAPLPPVSPPIQPDSVRTANQLASAFDHLGQSSHSLHSAFRGLSSGFNLMWLTWGEILPLLAGAAVSMGVTEVVKQGKEFETTLYRIENLAGITGESLQNLKKTFYEMGDSTIYSAQQAAEAAAILGLAGLKGEEVAKALRPTLAFAAAGEVTTEKAAEVLTAVGTAYAYAANSYSVVSDVIMKAAADSITSVDEMAESFKTASVLAQTYGVSLQDTAYALQGLAQIGITGSAAGTSLRNMYQELTKTHGAVGKVMKDLGVSAVESTGEMRGLLDIVTDLQMGLINLTGSEQNRYKAIISNERGNKALSASLADFNKEYKAYVATLSAADQALVNHGKTQQADLARKDAVIAASQKLRARLAQEFASAQGMTFFAGLEKSLTTAGKFDGITASFKNGLLMAFDSAQPALNAFALSLRDLFKSPDVREGFSSFITGVVRAGSAALDWLRTLGPVVTGIKEFGQGLLNVAQTLGQILSPLVSMTSYVVALISPFNQLSTQLAALAVGYVLWNSSIVRFLGVLALQTGGLISQGVALAANTFATVANGNALSASTAAKVIAHNITGAYAGGLALLTGQTTAATLASMRHSGALTAVGAAARVAATGIVAFGMALSVASVVGMVLALAALASSYLQTEDAATQARKAAEKDAEDRIKNLKLQMDMSQDMMTAEINSNKVKLDELKKGSSAEEAATRALGAQVIARINSYYAQIEALRSLRKEMEINNVTELHGTDTYRAYSDIIDIEAKYAEMTRRNTTARNRAVVDAQIDIDTLVAQNKELAFLSDQASKAARKKPQGVGEGSVEGGKTGGASRVPRVRDFDLQFEKDRIAAIKSSNDKQLAVLKSGYDLQLDVAQASYDAGLSSFAQYQVAVSDLTQRSEAERLALIAKAEDKAQAEAKRAHDQSLKIFEKELAEFKGTAQEKADYREKLGQKYVNNYTQIEQNLTSATESAEQQRVEITNDALKRRTLAYYKFMGEVGKVIKENQTFWQQDANEWAKADAMKALGDQYAYVSDQSTYSAQAEKAAAMAKAEAFYKYQGEVIRLNEELKKLREQEELLFNKEVLSETDLKDMANLSIGKARLTSQLQVHSEKSAEATAKAAEKAYQQVQEGAVINLQNATTDAIMNGILNGGEAAKKSLRAILVAELMKPVRMIVQAVVNPIVGAVAGAFGIGASPTAAMAGQAGSSVLGSAASNLLTSTTLGGSSLAAIGESIGTGFMATIQGSSVTSAAATYAAAGQTGVSAGLSIGAAAPWILGGLGILNILGAFRKTKKVGGGLTGTLGDNGKVVDYDLMRKSGTLLSGPDYSARVKDQTSVWNDAIQRDWKTVTRSTLEMAASLGLSTEAAKNFSTTLGTDSIHPDLDTKGIKLDDLMNKGLSDEQYAQEVNKRIGEALLQGSNELAQKILGSWQNTTREITEVIREGDTETFVTKTVTDTKYVQSQYAKLGETAIETLTRLASSLSTANSFLALLGNTLYESSLVGGDKASKWADSFGGADKFKEKVEAFVNVAFSPLERSIGQFNALDKQAKSLGLTGAMSARSLRDVVKGLDLTTESGRDLSARLIEIAPGMDAAMEGLLASVGVNGDDLATTFTDSIIAGYDPSSIGDYVSGLLVANIEKAIIQNASQQIFDIITKDIVLPMIQAQMAGGVLSEAVMQAGIDKAIELANAYATILNDPKVRSALDQLQSGLSGPLAGIAATFQSSAKYTDYLNKNLGDTDDAAKDAADALEDLAKKFDEAKKSLNDDFLDLQIDRLRAEGKEAEAAAIERQKFISQYAEFSQTQKDELLALYDRNKAYERETELLRKAKEAMDSFLDTLEGFASSYFGSAAGREVVFGKTQRQIQMADFSASPALLPLKNLSIGDLLGISSESLKTFAYQVAVSADVAPELKSSVLDWIDTMLQANEAVESARTSSKEALAGARNVFATPAQQMLAEYGTIAEKFSALNINFKPTAETLKNLSTTELTNVLNTLESSGDFSDETKTEIYGLVQALLELKKSAEDVAKAARQAALVSEESFSSKFGSFYTSGVQSKLFLSSLSNRVKDTGLADKVSPDVLSAATIPQILEYVEFIRNSGDVAEEVKPAFYDLAATLLSSKKAAEDTAIKFRETLISSLDKFVNTVYKASDQLDSWNFNAKISELVGAGLTNAADLLGGSVREIITSVQAFTNSVGNSDELKAKLLDVASGIIAMREAADQRRVDQASETTDYIYQHLEKLTNKRVKELQAEAESLTTERESTAKLVEDLKAVFDALDSAIADLRRSADSTKRYLLSEARKQFRSFATPGAALPKADELSKLIADANEGLSSTRYTSIAEADYERLSVAAELEAIKKNSKVSLTDSEKQLEALDKQLKSLDEQTKFLEDQLQAQRDAIDELRSLNFGLEGMLLGLTTIDQTIVALGSALSLEAESRYQQYENSLASKDAALLATLSPQTVIQPTPQRDVNPLTKAPTVTEAPKPEASDKTWYRADTGLGLVGGELFDQQRAISFATKYAADNGMQALYTAVQAAGFTLAETSAMLNISQDEIKQFGKVYNLPQFAVGTNLVPKDMVAMLHQGEAVVPKAYNPLLVKDKQTPILVDLLSLSKQNLKAVLQSVQTQKTVASSIEGMKSSSATGGQGVSGSQPQESPVYSTQAQSYINSVVARATEDTPRLAAQAALDYLNRQTTHHGALVNGQQSTAYHFTTQSMFGQLMIQLGDPAAAGVGSIGQGGVGSNAYAVASKLLGKDYRVTDDDQMRSDLERYLTNLPAFATGTDYVPSNMIALLHKGEQVVPAKYNPTRSQTSGAQGEDPALESLLATLVKKVEELIKTSNRTANAVNGRGEMPQLVKVV